MAVRKPKTCHGKYVVRTYVKLANKTCYMKFIIENLLLTELIAFIRLVSSRNKDKLPIGLI
jgi:hypothetical protein